MVGNSCWCHCRQHKPLALFFQQSWWFAQIFREYFQQLISFGKTFVFNSSSTIIGQTQTEIYVVLCCVVVCLSGGVSNHHCRRSCCCSCCLVIISRQSWQGQSFHLSPSPAPFGIFIQIVLCFVGARVACLFASKGGSNAAATLPSSQYVQTESFYQHSFDAAPVPLSHPTKCNKLLPRRQKTNTIVLSQSVE